MPFLKLHTLLKGIDNLLFPSLCPCCGDFQPEYENLICGYCIDHLFEPANPQRQTFCAETLLPDYIAFQDALWKYGKGSYLQEILIKLKYHGMAAMGVQLGKLTGAQLLSHPSYQLEARYILVPVPLHPARLRKRGYNQAERIASGISAVTNIPVLEPDALSRIRDTHTQTEFNLTQRMANLKQVFQVEKPHELAKSIPIIVDDVFTTGATSLELAATIMPHSDHRVGIITVALV